jgi:hypothetical protein
VYFCLFDAMKICFNSSIRKNDQLVLIGILPLFVGVWIHCSRDLLPIFVSRLGLAGLTSAHVLLDLLVLPQVSLITSL